MADQTAMMELIETRSKFNNIDLEDLLLKKVFGEIYPGTKVKIEWIDREINDIGYSFCLPDQIFDEGDIFIHIPYPDNSDGIGDAPPEWKHLYELITNKRIKSIQFATVI